MRGNRSAILSADVAYFLTRPLAVVRSPVTSQTWQFDSLKLKLHDVSTNDLAPTTSGDSALPTESLMHFSVPQLEESHERLHSHPPQGTEAPRDRSRIQHHETCSGG